MGEEYVHGSRDAAAPRPSARRAPVRRAMVVGAASDRVEAEADRVADEVMRTLERGPARTGAILAPESSRIRLNRSAATVGEAGGAVPPETDAGIRAASGRGRPLDGRVRRTMETGFGADFSAVRVHTDGRAADLNDQVQARAFTTGADIFFGAGNYAPERRAGRRLLAHELAHVVQQGHAGIARRWSAVRRSGPPDAGGADARVEHSPAGVGRSRITLRSAGDEVGSVTVEARGDAAEATALSVSPDQRGRGYGADLLAAAARRAEAAGSSRIALGADDSGSGHLDGWYRSLGFRAEGTVDDHTRFEAATSVLRSTTRPGTSRVIRRMKEKILWYEKVDGQEKPVGRTKPKPGGYRIIKGLKVDGIQVFESQEQRSVKTTASEKERAAAKAKQEEEERVAKAMKEADKAAQLTAPAPDGDYDTVFVLDARKVRFTQDSIGDTFSDGGSISTCADKLKSGAQTFKGLPVIRVFLSPSGNYVSLDNRRLWCCKQADSPIRCIWATPAEIRKEGYKFTSGRGPEGSLGITVRWQT